MANRHFGRLDPERTYGARSCNPAVMIALANELQVVARIEVEGQRRSSVFEALAAPFSMKRKYARGGKLH